MASSASPAFSDYLSQVQQYMQKANRKETFQDGKLSGCFYGFSDQATAEAMRDALTAIGIVGSYDKPKFVAQHMVGNSNFGVILTEENETTIRALVKGALGHSMPATTAAAGSASVDTESCASASPAFTDRLSQVREYMRKASHQEIFQNKQLSGCFYGFSDQATAEGMRDALAAIDIVGGSGKPKFVGKHMFGNPNVGVILTNRDEQNIFAFCQYTFDSSVSVATAAGSASQASSGSASITSGKFPVLSSVASKMQCVYLTRKQIEEWYPAATKYFLYQIPDAKMGADGFFGFVVFQENTKWVLHLCPGGGYGRFSLVDLGTAMPYVIRSLQRLNIQPDHYFIDGRHPSDTDKNFQAWMKAQNTELLL